MDLVILMSFSNLNDAMTEPPRGHQFYFRYLSRQQLLNVTLAWRRSFLLYVKWVKWFFSLRCVMGLSRASREVRLICFKDKK